jgi:hypothetical protein
MTATLLRTGCCSAASVFLLVFFLGNARAEDRLRDFQNAINYVQDQQGCLSIPYCFHRSDIWVCISRMKEDARLAMSACAAAE